MVALYRCLLECARASTGVSRVGEGVSGGEGGWVSWGDSRKRGGGGGALIEKFSPGPMQPVAK